MISNIHDQPIKSIEMEQYNDQRGSLNALNFVPNINFDIKRFFFTHNIDQNISRGNHAHKNSYQIMFSINGLLDIEFDNGQKKQIIELNDNTKGLIVPPLIWTKLFNYSKDNILLVFSSEIFNEDDYLRNYNDYISYLNNLSKNV